MIPWDVLRRQRAAIAELIDEASDEVLLLWAKVWTDLRAEIEAELVRRGEASMLTDMEAATLAAAEKDLGMPVEHWLRTLGYDPDSKTDRGGTLAEAVRQEASQSAAAIGRSFREGAGL